MPFLFNTGHAKTENTSAKPPAIWMQQYNGAPLDLLELTREQIQIDAIAVSLARIPRFNGHTELDVVWTVAEHSLLVDDLVATYCNIVYKPLPPKLGLAALLHDAHEAYIGDITTPVEQALEVLTGTNAVAKLKEYIQGNIHTVFSLPVTLPEEWMRIIKWADTTALRIERRDLMAPSQRDWKLAPLDRDDTLIGQFHIDRDEIRTNRTEEIVEEFLDRVLAYVSV